MGIFFVWVFVEHKSDIIEMFIDFFFKCWLSGWDEPLYSSLERIFLISHYWGSNNFFLYLRYQIKSKSMHYPKNCKVVPLFQVLYPTFMSKVVYPFSFVKGLICKLIVTKFILVVSNAESKAPCLNCSMIAIVSWSTKIIFLVGGPFIHLMQTQSLEYPKRAPH